MIKVQVAHVEDKRKEGPGLQFGHVYHRSSIALVYRFDTMMVEGKYGRGHYNHMDRIVPKDFQFSGEINRLQKYKGCTRCIGNSDGQN